MNICFMFFPWCLLLPPGLISDSSCSASMWNVWRSSRRIVASRARLVSLGTIRFGAGLSPKVCQKGFAESLQKKFCHFFEFRSIFMGIEHEAIHLETSSVLFRETPIHLMQVPCQLESFDDGDDVGRVCFFQKHGRVVFFASVLFFSQVPAGWPKSKSPEMWIPTWNICDTKRSQQDETSLHGTQGCTLPITALLATLVNLKQSIQSKQQLY